MRTPQPKTAELVLKYAATVVVGIAFWGTLWNLLYGQFLSGMIKICVGEVDPGTDWSSWLDTCKPISHVSWVLIIICAVLGAGLAVGYAILAIPRTNQSARAATGWPGAQVSPFGLNPPKPTKLTNPSVAGPPVQPPPKRDPFAFFGDPRLVGLWTLCGVVLTAIQIFFR